MNNDLHCYALVTGASQGLGRAIAEELARRGHNLLLVSLPGTGLPELSDSLAGRYSIMARFVETDLMRREGISVSVGMPGPVLTNARVSERIRKTGFLGRLNVIDADKAAAYLVRMMYRGRGVILPRWTVRVSYIIGSFLPYRLLILMLGRLFRGVG